MNTILIAGTGALGTTADPSALNAGQLGLYAIVDGKTVNWQTGNAKPSTAWIALGLGGGRVRNSPFLTLQDELRLEHNAYLAGQRQQRTIVVSFTGNDTAVGTTPMDEFVLRLTTIKRLDPTNNEPWNGRPYYAYGVFATKKDLYDALAARINEDALAEVRVVSTSADGLVLEPVDISATFYAAMTFTRSASCLNCYSFSFTQNETQALRYAKGDGLTVTAEEVAASYELGSIENWMSWIFPTPTKRGSVAGTYDSLLIQHTGPTQRKTVGFKEENMVQIYAPTGAGNQVILIRALLEEMLGKTFN